MILMNIIVLLLSILPCFISDYSPNLAVKAAHNIPRISSTFHKGSNEFYYSTSISNSYYKSLLVLPVIICGLGLLSVLIYIVLMIGRLCCSCIRCLPKNNIRGNKLVILYTIIILLVFGIIADHSQYYGNKYITKGVKNGGDSLKSLSTLFTSIYSNSESINSNSTSISALIEKSTCPIVIQGKSTYLKDISIISSSSSSISSQISSLPDKINKYRDLLLHYGVDIKTLVLYIVYAVIMFLYLCFIISLAFRSKCFTQFSIVLTVPIVIVLTILCCVEMIAVSLLADVCISPTSNAISTIKTTASYYDTVTYYTSCQGTPPFQSDLANATYYTNVLNTTIYQLINNQYCQNHNTELKETIPYINGIYSSINHLSNDTLCQPLYNLWDNAINTGVCTNFFTGLYILWIAQFVISATLFFLLCFSSLIYQYYPNIYWFINNPEDATIDNEVDSTNQSSSCCCVRNKKQYSNIDNNKDVNIEMIDQPTNSVNFYKSSNKVTQPRMIVSNNNELDLDVLVDVAL